MIEPIFQFHNTLSTSSSVRDWRMLVNNSSILGTNGGQPELEMNKVPFNPKKI